MPCSLSGHGCPAPGPPQAVIRLPLASNSITGGAGLQQSERGGVRAAPRSSSGSDWGRCTTQMPSPLAATAAACPMSPWLGSGLGQNGSTSNTGASDTDAAAPLLVARAQALTCSTPTSAVAAITASALRLLMASSASGSLEPPRIAVKVTSRHDMLAFPTRAPRQVRFLVGPAGVALPLHTLPARRPP